MKKLKEDKHSQGLNNLESILSHLTHTGKEFLYEHSDVDFYGVDNKTLCVYEYKSSGHKKKALYQLRTHKKYFVPIFLNNNPDLELDRVKFFYANPSIIKLMFECSVNSITKYK